MKFTITILLALFAGVFAADESASERGPCTSANEGTTACKTPGHSSVLWNPRNSVVICRGGKWQLVEKCLKGAYCVPFPLAMCSGTYGHPAKPPKIPREEQQEQEVEVEFKA